MNVIAKLFFYRVLTAEDGEGTRMYTYTPAFKNIIKTTHDCNAQTW